MNRTDCGLRAAKPFIYRFFTGLVRPRVTVLGNEFVGEVEAVGSGVASFQVGDRVFGFNGASFGAHVEYMAIPEDGLQVQDQERPRRRRSERAFDRKATCKHGHRLVGENLRIDPQTGSCSKP